MQDAVKNKQKKIVRPIPTNIITGFLGVGKTTLILELLKQKPVDEIWAVLVNEFGEIGIDGNILSHSEINQRQISIREVPGGCMCCTSGLPMQIALNQLISHSKPKRLLIEPTGLGHPKEVIESLSQPHYQNTIDLKATLTLVDARKLKETRYTRHEIYQQQIQVADIIVATKSDLCSHEDSALLSRYCHTLGKQDTEILYTEYGRINTRYLDFPHRANSLKLSPPHTSSTHNEGEQEHAPHEHSHHKGTHQAQEHNHRHTPQDDLDEESDELMIRKENQGKGYFSCGWIFDPVVTFDLEKLQNFFGRIEFERTKAVAITEEGVFGFNKEGAQLTLTELNECMDSRLEIISLSQENWNELEQQLIQCSDFEAQQNNLSD